MFTAVHSDRSGRVYVSSDWGACAFDGARSIPLETAIPLPEGTALVPLAREAQGLDRLGRPRGIGPARWAVGALLPAGHTRTLHPAYRDDEPNDAPLAPLPTAAVCADESGALYVAAIPTRPAAAGAVAAGGTLAVRSGNRLARQLARCARDHACAGARAALRGDGVGALPVSARPNESPPTVVAPRARPDAAPREPAAFRPSAAEIAEVALAHLAAGGAGVSFGRACEGEPLTAVRLLEDAIARIRQAVPAARIHLETNGSSSSALRRLIDAGLGEVTFRLASARSDTYEAIHGPTGYRYTDVRAAIAVAREARIGVRLALLMLPGLSDRDAELEALGALVGDAGADVELRDLGADARRALALAPRADTLHGMDAAVARLLEAA